MGNTVKFAVSMSAGEFKDLESKRRKARKTRSEFVREAVRAWAAGPGRGARASETGTVNEEPGRYGPGGAAQDLMDLADLTDIAERRRRAIAATGRFKSGVSDLSENHDKYLAEGSQESAETGEDS